MPSGCFGDIQRSWHRRGMTSVKYDKLFLIVGGALILGFLIGFAAGMDNPPAMISVQWETLAAGGAAILGGWMAYAGATAQFREIKEKAAQIHAHKFNEACLGFLMLTDNSVDWGRLAIQSYVEAKEDDDWIEFIPDAAKETLSKLPEIPAEIADKELQKLHDQIRILLSWVDPNHRIHKVRKPDVLDIRKKIIEYLRRVETMS